MPSVDEVDLFLLVVVVAPALVTGGQHQRVDAECGDAQLAADLAKAIAVAEGVEPSDRVALAGDHVVDLSLRHWQRSYRRLP